jgi:hypothetical protein
MRRVFISHCHADLAHADALAKTLRGRGFQVWLDAYAIRSGARVDRVILDALEDTDALFVLISRRLRDETWGARRGPVRRPSRRAGRRLAPGAAPAARLAPSLPVL